MTTDTVAKAFSRKVRLSTGDAVVTGIAKGAGMIRPDMATMLGFVATDADVSRKVAAETGREGRRPLVQLHQRRRRYLDQRLLHADRHRAGPEGGRAARPAQARGRAERRRPPARAGDRARRRGRDQVRHRAGRGRPQRGRMPPRRLRDRAFAAGQDGVLRLRPEPRPDPRRHRLLGRAARHGEGRPLYRRRPGRQGRRPPPGLPRGAGRGGDEEAGVHWCARC